MEHELKLRGINFKSEFSIPLIYKDLDISAVLRCDFFIENCLIVELKAITEVLPIHEAITISYAKLLKAPMGLIINFHVANIYDEGQQTYLTEFYRGLK